MKKEMTIIGMSESLGFPFRYNHKSRRSIQDHLLESLRDTFEQQNYTVNYLNAFSMFFNKSWHSDGILRHNLTVKEIKRLIQVGNDTARNNFLTKFGMPKHLGTLEAIEENDETTHIRTLIESQEDVLFLFDIGINDFMYYLNHNFFVGTTQYLKSRRVVQDLIEGAYLEQVIEHIRENLKLIFRINPHAHVALLGFSLSFYTKKCLYHFYQNFPLYQKLEAEVDLYNRRLKELEKEFPIQFVDLSSFEHQKSNVALLTEEIVTKYHTARKHYKEKSNVFIDDFGLDGMIADTRERLIALKKQTDLKSRDEIEANARQIEKNQQELAIFVKLKKEAARKEKS